tara:strand:- start:2947 stop:3381 length:435 start_codon:yes stop_codon:yes gene_type:complete
MNILLISGGADSMYLYNKYKYDIYVYIDYGQEQIHKEKDILKNINVKYLKILPIKKNIDGFYVARNLKLIQKILDYFDNVESVSIGTNKEDKYSDNNREYYNLLEKVIQYSYQKNIKIITPLINLNKDVIVKNLKKYKIKYFTD